MAKPGKSVASETLPHRSALTRITGGDESQRTINQYAKATPLDATGQGIMNNPQLPQMTLAGGSPKGKLFG
jgi:hypothetical protein